jgi:hypothetical protein
MLLAWTAALVVYAAAAIGLTLALMALATWATPPGRIRTAMQIVLALIGLAVTALLLWD